MHILLDKIVKKPVKKENKQPDWEIDDSILEVKTQTFFTSGTAGDKILGCPFKYANIPELYGKPALAEQKNVLGQVMVICQEQNALDKNRFFLISFVIIRLNILVLRIFLNILLDTRIFSNPIT